jgi:simple sugar transport system permease protein
MLGFVVGAIFMIGSNEEFIKAMGYFFTRPMDAFAAAWNVVSAGYGALFKGSIYNADADTLEKAMRPITETLRLGAPLIAAGLGIGLTFRVGLFNIGGTGQLIFGMIFATFVSTRVDLPLGLHLLIAILAAVLGATMLGSLVGLLKARTGAHEVILTIMLNYIAISVFFWLLRSPELLGEQQATGNAKSSPISETAVFPSLFGDTYAIHWGFILMVLAVPLYWWLMERSTIGFRLRMVGYNPEAAKTAGINVNRTYMLAMGLSAAFVGLAASNQALGSTSGLSPSAHAGIGFDAITVALLGGSSAPGILLAGLLFGAFKAGSPSMQVIGISPEVLGIVQGAIVLFIAAPPLIRAIFGLPKPQTTNALGALRSRLFGKGGAK